MGGMMVRELVERVRWLYTGEDSIGAVETIGLFGEQRMFGKQLRGFSVGDIHHE